MAAKPNTPGNAGADDVRSVAPALERYTQGTLAEVWKRPGLSARDRGLITVTVLIARNQTSMDNGLTQSEASEVLTHLLFYAGWPNVMSAVPVAKEVFEKRPK